MAKQKKQVIILAIILAAALIAFFAAKKYTEKQEAAEDKSYTAYSADSDDILKITCTGKDITGYTISDESGSWTFADTGAAVDEDVTSSILDTLGGIDSTTYLKDVTDPQMTVTVTDKDGNETTLTFGDYNSVTGEYYLRIDDQNILYGASESDYQALAKNAEDMAAPEETETDTEAAQTETEAAETETETAAQSQ